MYDYQLLCCAAPNCVCLQVEVKVAQSKEALAMQTGKGRTSNGRNGFGNNLITCFFALHLILGMSVVCIIDTVVACMYLGTYLPTIS